MSDDVLNAEATTPKANNNQNAEKRQKKSTKARKSRKSKKPDSIQKPKRTRTARTFPASSFEDALNFTKSIIDYGSGQAVRRLSLFNQLNKSPESSASRMMVTNANKYGLIEGSYTADILTPTADGLKAVSDEVSAQERIQVRVKLSILDIPLFNSLYEKYTNNKLPVRAALIDSAKDFGAGDDVVEEAIDTFVVNLRFVGLLQTLSGAERIVTISHLLESITRGEVTIQDTSPEVLSNSSSAPLKAPIRTASDVSLEQICFYIAPIGEDGSETRKHSDMLLGSIVEPSLEQFKLKVVRADAISAPGMIGKQIIEHIFGSKLVIVDLSFHNPNVFYELAIRHMLRKPIVQIMRKANSIPFDVNQQRTIIIDTSDIYSFVPRIETYRAEISNQVRHALEGADAADNPISFVFPELKFILGSS